MQHTGICDGSTQLREFIPTTMPTRQLVRVYSYVPIARCNACVQFVQPMFFFFFFFFFFFAGPWKRACERGHSGVSRVSDTKGYDDVESIVDLWVITFIKQKKKIKLKYNASHTHTHTTRKPQYEAFISDWALRPCSGRRCPPEIQS